MKRFIAIILVIFILCGFTACGPSEGSGEYIERKLDEIGFGFVKDLGTVGVAEFYLVYDYKTRVEYIFIDGYYEINLIPYYDENGNVMIYDGGKN